MDDELRGEIRQLKETIAKLERELLRRFHRISEQIKQDRFDRRPPPEAGPN